jgi:transposase
MRRTPAQHDSQFLKRHRTLAWSVAPQIESFMNRSHDHEMGDLSMCVAATMALTDETRLRLERLARERSTPVRVVDRSRIVLLNGDGLQNKQIAERMEVAPQIAVLWHNCFLTPGVDGLLRYASLPGRTPSISTRTVTQMIEKTTQSKPANSRHWSRSTMAREAGISESSVGRIWRSHGLKPHHGHRRIHRRTLSESQTPHLDRQSHRHPQKGHASTGGRE